MLQLFSDDSGKLNDGPVCALAGYLSTAERWGAFSNDWQAAIDEEPSIAYLKASEAFALRDEFKKFDSDRRDTKLKRLIPIITRHAMAGFCVAVPSEPFRRIMQGWMNPEYLDRPYFMLFHEIIVRCTAYADQNNLDDKIDFIFDIQGDEPKAMGDFMAQFHEFAETAPESAKRFLGGPPSFKSEQDARPIQAADLLAWWSRRGVDQSPSSSYLEQLLEVPTFMATLDEQRLRAAARKVMEARINEAR